VEQGRRESAGFDPGGLSDFKIGQGHECVGQRLAFGVAAAVLEEFSQYHTGESNLLGVNQQVESAFLRGIQTIEEWNPD
jgi:hypothetical protein